MSELSESAGNRPAAPGPAASGVGSVSLVGAGPGDPGLITVKGLQRLRAAEVVVYDRLVAPQLLDEVPEGAERIYVGKASAHHSLPQEQINALLVDRAKAGKRVVRLKGGDPFVFGRGGEEAEALVLAGVPFEVVPGVTSAIGAAAYAGIPVTHRDYSASFTVVTGHRGARATGEAPDWTRLAPGTGTIVCLMGVERLADFVQQLLRHGRSPETPVALIRWGSWPDQDTLVGTLSTILKLAATRSFGPPAVAVVGDVVRLRETLRWFDKTQQP